jgi:hypothetical protein
MNIKITTTALVAGMQYRDVDAIRRLDLPPGTPLTLIPQPVNPYDVNAMKVMYNDVFLGYIPKTITAYVSQLPTVATVHTFDVSLSISYWLLINLTHEFATQ